MDEESIAAEPSEENGNIPAEEMGAVSTPSEQTGEEGATNEEASTGENPEATPTTEPELYELPDGRKVDGATLAKEWKDNFLPDYTKKSQTLAEIEKSKQTNQTPEQKPYQDPNWTPKDWPELIEVAKQEIKGDLEAQAKAQAEARAQLEDSIAAELTELKKVDPTLNENALFLHANEYREKYGVSFPNLTAAHAHMKDVQALTKNVQQTTAKNIAKRADPVSASPSATGAKPDPSQFQNARDYIRSLKT